MLSNIYGYGRSLKDMLKSVKTSHLILSIGLAMIYICLFIIFFFRIPKKDRLNNSLMIGGNILLIIMLLHSIFLVTTDYQTNRILIGIEMLSVLIPMLVFFIKKLFS